MTVDHTWVDDAACKEYPTEIFFTIDDKGWNRENAQAVRLACKSCAVESECLEAAFREEQKAPSLRFGIRGGMSARQREIKWLSLIQGRAGWCATGRHIVEHDEDCGQCRMT